MREKHKSPSNTGEHTSSAQSNSEPESDPISSNQKSSTRHVSPKLLQISNAIIEEVEEENRSKGTFCEVENNSRVQNRVLNLTNTTITNSNITVMTSNE